MPPALDGEFGFAASGTCLVTAGKADAWFAGGGAAARVFHSVDRGKTWSVTDTPLVRSDAGGIFSLAVRDPETLVAVGGDFEKPHKSADTSAYSTDGGTTWHPGGDLDGYRSGSAFLPRTSATGSPSDGRDRRRPDRHQRVLRRRRHLEVGAQRRVRRGRVHRRRCLLGVRPARAGSACSTD